MSNFADRFNNLKNQANDADTTFEEKGTIGSSGNKYKVEEDGIYNVVIDMVEFKDSMTTKSAWYEVTFKTETGAKIKNKMFVLNSDGQPYKIDKNGRKQSTYGWNKMASLNYLITDQWDGLPIPEEKEIMVYDYNSSSEVAKVVPIVPSLIGKPLTIAIKMILEDGYPDATQERLTPDVRLFLDPVSHQSSTEKRNNAEAKVVEDFKASIEKSPAPIDKREKSKGGSTTTSSTPAASTGAPAGFNFSK